MMLNKKKRKKDEICDSLIKKLFGERWKVKDSGK